MKAANSIRGFLTSRSCLVYMSEASLSNAVALSYQLGVPVFIVSAGGVSAGSLDLKVSAQLFTPAKKSANLSSIAFFSSWLAVSPYVSTS